MSITVGENSYIDIEEANEYFGEGRCKQCLWLPGSMTVKSS